MIRVALLIRLVRAWGLAMPDAFQGIIGQPKVRDFLRASVVADRVTHAYLFVGPAGSNKTQAAHALAQALLCPKGASGPRGGFCGACENCKRASRKSHPDIHFCYPEGANGYLIEQVREIVSDISLAPIQAARKIYIIDRADLLGHSAANALLKTLEEPPEDVVLILLGRTRESVLQTIASRCQIVPFRHIPPSEAVGIISQNTGADASRARHALEASGGSITGAIAFLGTSGNGNERYMLRKKLLMSLGRISEMDTWRVLQMAKGIVEDSNGPLDSLRTKQEEELAVNRDFLQKSAIRRIEDRNNRQLAKETLEYMRQALSIMASWIRDVEMVADGCPELVINDDFVADLNDAAVRCDLAKLSVALRAVDDAKLALDYNVSPETCFDAVLLEIRRAFDDACCTS